MHPVHAGDAAKMVAAGCCSEPAALNDFLHLCTFLASKLTHTKPLLLVLMVISLQHHCHVAIHGANYHHSYSYF